MDTDGDVVTATVGYEEVEGVEDELPSFSVEAVEEEEDEVVVVIIDVVAVVIVSDVEEDGAPPPFVKCKLFIVAAVCKYYKNFCIFNCRNAPLFC